MRKHILFTLGLLCLPCLTWASSDDALTIATPSGSKAYKLSELKRLVPTYQVTIQDSVYKKKKTYDAFRLSEILKLAGEAGAGVDEVAFVAADGYSPSMPLKLALERAGGIAYQEHGRSKKEPWEKFERGKGWATPAPFYVVWEEGAQKEGEHFPKPYQLVKIEFVSFAKRYEKLYPATLKEGSVEKKGFLVFKDQCVRCHSINLQGGDVGPELNIPKSVTEYWDKKVLRAFIHNVPEFRAKSKMPSFKSLKDEEIDAVVSYLEFMKGNKVGR